MIRFTTPDQLTASLKVDETQIKASATKGKVRCVRYRGRMFILKSEIPKLTAQVAADVAIKVDPIIDPVVPGK